MGNRQLRQRTLFLFLCLFLAVAEMAIYAKAAQPLGSSLTPNLTEEKGLQIAEKAKQALIVIFPYFLEEPYSETRSILENKGVKVLVASAKADPVSGYNKKLTVKPDLLLNQVRSAEYDAIVIIGGSEYYPGDNVDAIRIAKGCAAEGKVLASYSNAMSTLIKADVLKGKRVAAAGNFSSFLQKAGATMSSATLVQDGKIITASSRSAPQPFAEKIVAALTAGSD
jgi:protease I